MPSIRIAYELNPEIAVPFGVQSTSLIAVDDSQCLSQETDSFKSFVSSKPKADETLALLTDHF